jgi:hypothetical protein
MAAVSKYFLRKLSAEMTNLRKLKESLFISLEAMNKAEK